MSPDVSRPLGLKDFSYVQKSGSNAVVLEAGARRCTPIATDMPGCRIAVIHEVDDPRAPVGVSRALAIAQIDEGVVTHSAMGAYREAMQ